MLAIGLSVPGVFFATGAFALFVCLPLFALVGHWRRLSPAARRAIVGFYLLALALTAGLAWMVLRWLDRSL